MFWAQKRPWILMTKIFAWLCCCVYLMRFLCRNDALMYHEKWREHQHNIWLEKRENMGKMGRWIKKKKKKVDLVGWMNPNEESFCIHFCHQKKVWYYNVCKRDTKVFRHHLFFLSINIFYYEIWIKVSHKNFSYSGLLPN